MFFEYLGDALAIAALIGIALNLKQIAQEMQRKNDREEKQLAKKK